MLAEALARIGQNWRLSVCVAGCRSESPILGQLRALPNVVVENRLVPEAELGDLLARFDALVLPYQEAPL